jgi:hypothetical protein
MIRAAMAAAIGDQRRGDRPARPVRLRGGISSRPTATAMTNGLPGQAQVIIGGKDADPSGTADCWSGSGQTTIAIGDGTKGATAVLSDQTAPAVKSEMSWVRVPVALHQRLFFKIVSFESTFIRRLWPADLATSIYLRPRAIYLSRVIDTLVCLRWSAPILADRPPPLMRAGDRRKLCLVTPAARTPSRTCRHCLLKLFGSRQVPAVDGKIIACVQ